MTTTVSSTSSQTPREEIWSRENSDFDRMVKISRALLKNAEGGISKMLTEILVCPISKQPLRHCEETGTLISDTIGVSFPIVDGIPCLVPHDGKILDQEDEEVTAEGGGSADSSAMENKH